MRTVIAPVGLLVVLFVYLRETVGISSALRDGAKVWQGPLPCGGWDCQCALHQRSCCCVAQQLFDMEERVFGNILSQRETLSQLHRLIKETIGGRKVAFTVSTTASTDCFGPFTSDVTVPYGNVTLNYGNGYNPALGVFTAPRAGVYSFSFLAYSSAGAEAMRLYHRLALVQDGREVSAVWEDNREDLQDSGTHTLLLPLSRGSQVYIQLLSGRVLCDTAGHNKFSGYLLYPTEG